MSRLLGVRPVCRQKTCHLINSLPLVSCTHNFILVNLNSIGNRLSLGSQSASTSIKTILEIYGLRMNIIYWCNDVIPHTMNDMPISFFCN